MGVVDLTFPDFNQSKKMIVQPDIMYILLGTPRLSYNLIIGIETIRKWKCILNFEIFGVPIDGSKLHMKSKENLMIESNASHENFQ